VSPLTAAQPRPRSRPSGRRTQEERSAETRARLLDATLESLIEFGYARTSTTAVCARARLSRGAQLHHFPTKADLVIAAVAHLARRRADELRREVVQGGSDGERLARALDAIWASFSGPLFLAALELWVASRSDAELRASLVRFERQVGRAMAALFWIESIRRVTSSMLRSTSCGRCSTGPPSRRGWSCGWRRAPTPSSRLR